MCAPKRLLGQVVAVEDLVTAIDPAKQVGGTVRAFIDARGETRRSAILDRGRAQL